MTTITDIGFDIETLGVKPGCVVLSVAAIAFDRNENPSMENLYSNALTFSTTFSMTRQLALDLTADKGTLEFYFKSEGQLSQIATSGACIESIHTSLGRFNDFIIGMKKQGLGNDVCLWANSPNFDVDIIRVLYEKTELEFPVPFYKWMDVRTIRDSYEFLYGRDAIPKADKTKKHDPLYDCIYQTHLVQSFFNAVKHESVKP